MEFRLVKRMTRGTRGCKALALFSNFKWARSPAFRHDAGAMYIKACNHAPRANRHWTLFVNALVAATFNNYTGLVRINPYPVGHFW